jgi:hypothetical protein
MSYLLLVTVNSDLAISLGSLNDSLLIGMGIVGFLISFFIYPSRYGFGVGLYPFDKRYHKDVFSKFEAIIHLSGLVILMALIYVYNVHGFVAKKAPTLIDATIRKVVEFFLIAQTVLYIILAVVVLIALLAVWVYFTKIKKYPPRKRK